MPFDSNGTFNRVIPGGWQADAAAGIKITALRHDNEDDGFATGLSTCITKDGRTQPLANIPMNNKKITNLADPDNPQDAATRNYVDTFKSFTTGAVISGAGPINGFINFTAPTGINGIGWTTADMSWVGKLEEAGKINKRLCVNDAKDGTGNDVLFIDEGGRLNNNGNVSHNLSWNGTGLATIAAGTATMLAYTNGGFTLASNDTATTYAWQATTFRTGYTVSMGGGHLSMSMDVSGSGKTVQLLSTNAGRMRWNMQLGSGAAETGANVGSDFLIHAYDDAGGYLGVGFSINRNNRYVNFPAGTYGFTTHGNLTVEGTVTSSQIFASSSASAILSCNAGPIYFRPNGAGSGTEQVYIDTAGQLNMANNVGGILAGKGIRAKNGATVGGNSGNWMNLWWASPYVYVFVDNTNIGAIAWQSDYRFKKDITPLPSMWDKVKTLRPIQYSIKDWGLFKNDDTPHWGFIAHELQERLIESASTGHKDEENVVQSPNPLALIAALTKALQEAMTRIEALEARVPA